MFIHISYMLAPYSNTTLGFYVMSSLKKCVKINIWNNNTKSLFKTLDLNVPSNLHAAFMFTWSHHPSPIQGQLHAGGWLQGSAPQRTLQELVFSVNGWGVQNPCWHAA